MSTQLTNPSDFNVKNIKFSKPETGTIPGNGPTINFHRIRIGYNNDDGTTGDLVLATQKLFSFGVQENTDMNSGRVTGYSLPLCLHNRDGATDEETKFVEVIREIVEGCKDHLMDVKDDIGKYDLERSELKKLDPVYQKREKGKIVEGKGPSLYPKLLISKKGGDMKIQTFFTNGITGEDVDPLMLTKKYMHATCGIKIESIFVGTKISLQVKVYECLFEPVDTGMKRLLSKPKPPAPKPVAEVEYENEEEEDEDEDEDEADENSSLKDDDDEDEEEEEPEPEPEREPPKKKRGGRKKKSEE